MKQQLSRIYRVRASEYGVESDYYGNEVTEDRVRGVGCRHSVPCLTFKCISSHHRGSRATGACFGGDDTAELVHLLGPLEYKIRTAHEDIGWCDRCWCLTLDGHINKLVRDWSRTPPSKRKKHVYPDPRLYPHNTFFEDRSCGPITRMADYRRYLKETLGTWIPKKHWRI
jgi:hypothetical protein